MAQQQTNYSREEGIRKLALIIRNVRIAMLTTIDASGQLRSRPMIVQQADFDGDLWFFTRKSTDKANEIRHDSHVNVSIADADGNQFVSLSGRAALVMDAAKAAELWNPAYQDWVPKGPDDPDLTLIKIPIERAEYWDSAKGTMVHLWGTGRSPATADSQTTDGQDKNYLAG
jgi:general stress protein 26